MSGYAFGIMMPYCLYQSVRPWKLSLWQQWPFLHVHSTTRFLDASDWAELCHIAQLSWTVQSWCCYRYPQLQHQLHLQTHSHGSWRPGNNCLWGPLSFQTLRRGVNLRLDFGSTSILVSHTRSWCCRATSLPGITFTSVTKLAQICAWSYRNRCMVLWKRMRSVCMATFPDLYVMRWMSCFLEQVFPRSRLIARAFSRVI